MTDSLTSHVVVPVTDKDDARTTARALAAYGFDRVTVVHVIEKRRGGPDKLSLEQAEQRADEAFAAFVEVVPDADTERVYSTDVVEAIIDVADDLGADAVAFHPRGGSRLVKLLSGDKALSLITESDRPVIALPDPSER